jgi:hypothetical protein
VPTITQRSIAVAKSTSICGSVVTGCGVPVGPVSSANTSTLQFAGFASCTSNRHTLPLRSPP